MSKNGNTNGNSGDPNIGLDTTSLGIDPLSARSVVLSVLLGSHPPELPSRQLMRLAELFDIRAGTIRTALSRMSANGELIATEVGYALGPRLVQRQRQQDEGRRSPDTPWNGMWFTAIAAPDRRSVAERRAFRSAMVGARLGELRPDIWMRPANIATPDRPEEVIFIRGELSNDDPSELVRHLWALPELNEQSKRLQAAVENHRPSLDTDDYEVLSTTFHLSAAVIRFLRVEPHLPEELMPAHWTPPELRLVHADFEAAFQRLLRSFFNDDALP